LAKQNEILAERGYIGALRDYWIARADLERAVGEDLRHFGETNNSISFKENKKTIMGIYVYSS